MVRAGQGVDQGPLNPSTPLHLTKLRSVAKAVNILHFRSNLNSCYKAM